METAECGGVRRWFEPVVPPTRTELTPLRPRPCLRQQQALRHRWIHGNGKYNVTHL